MSNLAQIFLNLNSEQKRNVHLELCGLALRVWEKYVAQFEKIDYIEGVVGTYQVVEKLLPGDAFVAAQRGVDNKNIAQRYAEPITAMQDYDLEFPDHIGFAYYAIYNLFNKYVIGREIDDWLICNQALSAEADPENRPDLLNDAILKSL
jgi:hypothetical protein